MNINFRSTFHLVSFAVLALAASSSFAQLGRARTLPSEPMEFEDMPPAPAYSHATSSALIVPMGGFTSYQINVDGLGQNIVGDAANEPSMTIDPLNPNNIAVGWRQFDSVTSNFRQGGYAYSTNGGISWTFPGVLTNNLFRSDPVLATTDTGFFHYNSLQESFFSDEFGSTNHGQAWNLLGPATGGDKQWITVDATGGQGNAFVYQYWSTAGNNYGGRQFSRSTNGGSTWMNPINIPHSFIWGTLDVNPQGDLYLCGVSTTDSSFWVARSSNAKDGGVTPTFNMATNMSLGGDILWNPPVNPAGLGGQVWIACDKSGSGNIYLLSTTDRNNQNHGDVMFSRSTDGGATWSTPLRVNDDPVNQGKYHWFGTMSVSPSGRIDASWLDTRNDSGNTLSQLYYSYSIDGGVTFSPNIAVSPAFNPLVGWPQQNKIGDYMAMKSDENGAAIVYPATFNNEEDIYFVRVDVAPRVVLPTSFSFFRGVLVTGQLGSLFREDGDYLVAKGGFVANLNEPPLQVIVDGTSSLLAPSGLSFKCVSMSNVNALQQQTSLYNFVTGQYELVDSRQMTMSNQTVTVTGSGNLTRFVDQSSGKVRVKLAYKQTGFVPTVWTASIDQTNWTVTP